jgi:hypothetical protein
MKQRTDSPLPSHANSVKLSAEPVLAKLRRLSDEPTVTRCIVLIRRTEPQREHRPSTESDEPMRTKRRTDNADPTADAPSAEREVAERAKLRRESEETCPALSSSESSPVTQRAMLRTLRLDASVAKANMEAFSERTNARMLTALPTDEQLIADSEALPSDPLRAG